MLGGLEEIVEPAVELWRHKPRTQIEYKVHVPRMHWAWAKVKAQSCPWGPL